MAWSEMKAGNKSFLGQSSDTKPVTAPIGSTFLEWNTGVRYIWTGLNWEEDLEMIYALSRALNFGR